MDLDALLAQVAREGASDLQLTVEAPPVLRKNGALIRTELPPLAVSDMDAAFARLASAEQAERMRRSGSVEFTHSLPGIGRFRVNAYRQRGSIALAIRAIPAQALRLEELGIPDTARAFVLQSGGLVLVVAPPGGGKSTTLAAMVEEINQHRPVHIITLEDPIEHLHKHEKALVDQREVGVDCASFVEGVTSATRQDADAIVIGDLADPPTVAAALTVAGTGQLVLAAVRQLDVAGALAQLVDLFPRAQQAQIAWQLAAVLTGAVAQTLVPARSGGRVAVFEVLVGTDSVRALVREQKYPQLRGVIRAGVRHGMCAFEQSWRDLCERGVCDPSAAPLFVLSREFGAGTAADART